MKVINRLIGPLIFLGVMGYAMVVVLHEWKAYDNYEGDGTKENPHLIYTAQQLNQLSREVNNGLNTSGLYFKLMDDIDLKDFDSDLKKENGNWTPIGYSEVPDTLFEDMKDEKLEGTESNIQYLTDLKRKEAAYTAFSGNFDGNGYTIKNLKVVSDGEKSGGLFGNIKNASIYNLTLENVTINGEVNQGALIGTATKSSVYNINILGEVEIDGEENVGAAIGAVARYSGDTVIEYINAKSNLPTIGLKSN